MKPKTQLTTKPHGHQLRKHSLPPIEWVKSRYSYDPATGEITGPTGKSYAQGNLRLNLRYNETRLSVLKRRIAFALMRGRWPHLITNINGDKTDNRWNNLRETSVREACAPNGARIFRHHKGFEVAFHDQRIRSTLPCTVFKWREAAKAAVRDNVPLPPNPPRAQRCGKNRKSELAAMKWTRPKPFVMKNMTQANLPLDFYVRNKNND